MERKGTLAGNVTVWFLTFADVQLHNLSHLVPAICLGLLLLCFSGELHAETGYEAWLRYAPLENSARIRYNWLPSTVTILNQSEVLHSAQSETVRGLRGMLGRTPRIQEGLPTVAAIVLGTVSELNAAGAFLNVPVDRGEDGYSIRRGRVHGFDCLIISGSTDAGVLHGAFAFLGEIAREKEIAKSTEESPYVALRWINQWDNLDGSIERGYGGSSIFFDNGAVRTDLSRVHDYARLLASVGINGCVINNVNASPKVLSDEFIPQLARVADQFRPWGIRLGLSVNFASPKLIGGLDTFDPLDPKVATWWKEKVDQIYRAIPDFAGFVLKADSEGQLGPASYGRTPAEAANVVARALKPHGGYAFYRAFVYNHPLDWTNLKNDRAKAACDNFHPLDGKFDDNVIVQIKNGPIDFQVREPVSPLFSGLEKTNETIELQITQEYLGQQRHLVFTVPMWKQALDFDLHANGERTPVKEIVAGKIFHRPTGGFAGVANVGLDENWLGNPLAMANLYGFGRLAWNPNLSAETIADEWTRLSFGNDPKVVRAIDEIQLRSWRTYENYTGPLGLGTLTNILGPHYGPGVESAERNGWGQWIRADRDGVGMDRTIATGTGYIGQYPTAVQRQYEPLVSCPDELLLFFQHVPYTYVLHSGKTVIQHIYDSHYEGAASAREYVSQWESLKGHIDEERYNFVLNGLQYQAGHAIVWRDAITQWFEKMSGIPDAQNRVGNYSDRIEAESMQLQGYQTMNVVPWETASGGKGIECPEPLQSCTAKFRFQGKTGTYDLDVRYFDQNKGVSRFRVFVGDHLLSEWFADAHLPSNRPDGDSSTRRQITRVALRSGDEVRIEGVPDSHERAPLDYVAVEPISK